MAGHKRVTMMSDMEYRIYKSRLRRERIFKQRMMLFAVTLCIIFVCAVSNMSMRSSAGSDEDVRLKYYKAVTVGSGDTLWDIAGEYIDYSVYKDKNAYISEVMSINNINNADEIVKGKKITVPYYSTEFVR